MNNKAKSIVDKAINKAIKEKNQKGYRENLGYDQFNDVKNKVENLGLSYGEVADVMTYFTQQCDSI